jgi:lipid-A-disaccharide synthase
MEEKRKYCVFISAAEPSADAYCAALISALKQAGDDIEFAGVGGEKMEQAGCVLLEKVADKAVMAFNAIRQAGRFYGLLRRIKAFLKNNRTDLVVVCDSPAFNFHVAKAAKKLGIKTLFYVAPQLWAWAEWRINKLRRWCDRLCCILPFEQEWFGQRGVEAVFVGHPLLSEQPRGLTGGQKRYAGFDPQNVSIALMPGSRPAEIDTLWRPMQQMAVRIRRKFPNATFTAATIDDKMKEALRSMQVVGFRCRYATGTLAEVARSVDFSIVASGTATLQVAAAGCPMAIMYQSSRLLWHIIGRWLIKTKYLSLVNILAGKELVPEFMPYFTSTDPIVGTIEELLQDTNRLVQISDELIRLTQPLMQGNASQKVAEIVIDMLHSSASGG